VKYTVFDEISTSKKGAEISGSFRAFFIKTCHGLEKRGKEVNLAKLDF